MIRGGALFLGSVFLLGWLFFLTGGYDATIWWVDLRFLPGWLALLLSIAFGLALLHRAAWPQAGGRMLRVRRFVLIGLLINGAILFGLIYPDAVAILKMQSG